MICTICHRRGAPLAALVIGFLITLSDLSSAEPRNNAIEVTKLASTSPERGTAEWRSKFVRAIQEYCLAVYVGLPRNTSQDDGWLASELDSHNPERILRAVESTQFARQGLTLSFSNCIEFASRIDTLREKGGVVEAVLWIKLLREWNFADHWGHYGSRLGLGLRHFEFGGSSNLPNVRLAIIKDVLLPLLERR